MIEENNNHNLCQLSVNQQIELLKGDGLVFRDEDFATHILEHISFPRLRNYFRPLRVGDDWRFMSGVTYWRFMSGVTFEQVFSIYEFDSEFRRIVYSELEKIEISLRTQLSYIMVNRTGNSFWLIDPSNFCERTANSLMTRLHREIIRSDEDLTDNPQRWDDATNQPSWLVLEACSFGTLSILYKNLRNPSHRRIIADVYGLSSQVMESWLHALVYVRNICAHHARLWNRDLRISPLIPRNLTLPFLTFRAQNDRVYYVLSIILYFLQTINSTNAFVSGLQSLLAQYPIIELHSMGFPVGWEQEPLWIMPH